MDHEIKISAYANDAKFLAINVHSVELVLAICDTFQEFSSLKLNEEKSEACWIVSKKHDKGNPYCRWINLTDDKVCSLGVYHSYDPFIASRHNFLDLVKILWDCLQVWKLRSLSLAGKILVFNTLALSKSIHVATMTAPSKQELIQLWHKICDTEPTQYSDNLFGIMQVSISSITIPPGHDLKGAKTLPPGIITVYKTLPSGQNRESKPHPRDIKLENFTNISMNSDTI